MKIEGKYESVLISENQVTLYEGKGVNVFGHTCLKEVMVWRNIATGGLRIDGVQIFSEFHLDRHYEDLEIYDSRDIQVSRFLKQPYVIGAVRLKKTRPFQMEIPEVKFIIKTGGYVKINF